MLELVAQGPQPDHRWRRPVPQGDPFLLGRTTTSFRVPWDSRVSRSHARLRLVDGKLLVQKLDEAANPVFFQGSMEDTFWLEPGDHFVIGNTTFTLTEDQAFVTQNLPDPIRQKTFSTEFLRQVHYRDADRRIDVINRLPDVISSAADEQELMDRLVNTLLAGIPAASCVGIVRTSRNNSIEDGIEIVHWDQRESAGNFQPSESLIRQSIESSESVLHVWQRSSVTNPQFTFDFENDWAFICPIESEATPGWGIYVTGSRSRSTPPGEGSVTAVLPGTDSGIEDLQGDIKFCELVGSTLKNLLLVSQLQQRQASFRSFFSPVVMDVLKDSDAEDVLAPTECMLTILFCDLRGFAETSEAMADEIFKLLGKVSASLDIMTGQILQHGGVIGDFQGDSAMGFWGWPLPQADTAARAIRTAIEIESRFRTLDFDLGMGIATGMAVAGKIGTRDQVKVTAFGPLVNLASRLEGMTRALGATILTDRQTLDQVRQQNELSMATRCLGRFRPFGLATDVEVMEILTHSSGIKADEVASFHEAVQSFQSGDWAQAAAELRRFASDPVSRFLIDFMTESDRQPPADFSGTIHMKSK